MQDNKTHCFALMGYPGAGKSYGAQIIGDHFGVEPLTIGDIVREEAAKALPEDAGSDRIGEWVTNQLEEDETAIISLLIERIDNTDDDYAVIDSVRTIADINKLSHHFDEFNLIHIKALPEVRLERLQDRGRDGEEDFTMEDLETRDAREDEWGVAQIIEDDYPDKEVGNNIPDAFEEKLIGVVDGLAFSN